MLIESTDFLCRCSWHNLVPIRYQKKRSIGPEISNIMGIPGVVYFDQLLGAACTQKLVELLSKPDSPIFGVHYKTVNSKL